MQHLVAAQKDRVWSLIEQGAIIYVCGDGGKMEPDVKAALVAIIGKRPAPMLTPPRAGSTRWAPAIATCSMCGRGMTTGRSRESRRPGAGIAAITDVDR